MRLPSVERGRGMARVIFALARVLTGDRMPDVLRTLMYRRDFFGAPFQRLVQEVLRGPSEWSVGEREMFGSFVSDRNKCRF
jgi:hypothetical protein